MTLPRTGLVAGVVLSLGVLGAGPAWAYWTLTASTSATTTATSLQPPATVTATAGSLTSITVTVTDAPAGGPTPSSYLIRRGTTTICATATLGNGCVDSGLTPGTAYSYTVSSQLQNWTSAGTAAATAGTPDLPAPSTPALTSATDSGAKGDGYTNVTAPSFTGTAAAGATVTLVVDGIAVSPTATANGSGQWTITPSSAPSPNTAHSVKARAALNGATSPDSGLFPLLVDTVAPAAGTATTSCSTTATNGYCRGTTTVTVTGLSDAAPSSGLSGLSYSIAGGTSGTATISGGTATISFTAPDGTPTVTFNAKDVAGNSATPGTVTPGTPMDNTAPTVTSLTLANGGNAGEADKGDTVTIGLSDATSGISPKSICSAWTTSTPGSTLSGVNVTIANNGSNDTLTVTAAGCSVGSVALGGNYVSADTTFDGSGSNASSLTWSGGTSNRTGTLVIKLGKASTAGITGVTAGTPVLSPSTAITDLAGNAVSGSSVTGTSSRF